MIPRACSLILVVITALGGARAIAHPEHEPTAGAQPVRAGTSTQTDLVSPPETESFTFAVFGDRTGGPRSGIKILEQAVGMTNLLDPDFVMTVGDLIEGYDDDHAWLEEMREYKDIMGGLDAPWYPVAGNHDVYDAADSSPEGHLGLYREHFGPLYYSFDHKWAHVVVLFSDEGMDFKTPAVSQNMSETQMAWLREDLSEIDAERVLVFIHHPRWVDYYKGTNWSEVESVLQDTGVPVDVYAGHIHTLRDDGRRGNIRYRVMALTGGHAVRELEPTSFHHVAQVTVRRGRNDDTVALIPVRPDALIPMERFKGSEIDALISYRRSVWSSLEGAIAMGGDGPPSTLTLTLRAPEDRAAGYSVEFAGPPGWTASPQNLQGRLEPGESRRETIRVRPGPIPGSRPDIGVRSRMTYAFDWGDEETIESVHAPALVVVDPGEIASPDPEDGSSETALRLNGRAALRVDMPDPEGAFTLEFWVKGRAPNGRVSAVSKTQASSFGVFWSDSDDATGSVPVGVVHTAAGPLVLASRDAWAWEDWTHLALSFDGREARWYVNGSLQAAREASGPLAPNSLPLYVGADPGHDGVPTGFFRGAIDEVRLSSVARYGDEFTPERRFEPDAQTELLLHMDGRAGAIFPDSSGKNRHAWAVGEAGLVRVNR